MSTTPAPPKTRVTFGNSELLKKLTSSTGVISMIIYNMHIYIHTCIYICTSTNDYGQRWRREKRAERQRESHGESMEAAQKTARKLTYNIMHGKFSPSRRAPHAILFSLLFSFAHTRITHMSTIAGPFYLKSSPSSPPARRGYYGTPKSLSLKYYEYYTKREKRGK